MSHDVDHRSSFDLYRVPLVFMSVPIRGTLYYGSKCLGVALCPRIAARIVERREEAPIVTTQDLVAIIGNPGALKQKKPAWAKGLHPATRVFQV
jgi:hypothetical protein